MKYLCRALLTLVLAVGFPCLAQGPETGEVTSDLKIRVLAFNYARVLPRILARAKSQTTTVFRKIGVGLLWVDCLPPSAGVSTDPACGLPTDSTTLTLNLHTRFKRTADMILADNDMGYALLSGDRAGAAYSVTEHLAESGADRPQILGYVMAHEIGHLLLGSIQHSDSGIMRAVWRVKDLKAAGRGDLLFTVPQAEQIRANVVERMMQHKARPVASVDSAH